MQRHTTGGKQHSECSHISHIYTDQRPQQPQQKAKTAPKAAYFRTHANFRNVNAGDKLAITYFKSLRAHDENGQPVLLTKSEDGFAQVAEGMSARVLTVGSFSFLLPLAEAKEMFFSSWVMTSVGALAPSSVLYLKPFHMAGLWLAVMIMAPATF